MEPENQGWFPTGHLFYSVFFLFFSVLMLNYAPFSLSRFKVPVHPGLMIRDEPCHNRGGTVDNLGGPGLTGLNRVKPAHVPGCFKMFKTTGTHRE